MNHDHHAHMMGAKAETTTVHNHGAMAETTHNHGAMTTDSMGNTEGVMDHGAMMMQVHEINLQLLPLEVLICSLLIDVLRGRLQGHHSFQRMGHPIRGSYGGFLHRHLPFGCVVRRLEVFQVNLS